MAAANYVGRLPGLGGAGGHQGLQSTVVLTGGSQAYAPLTSADHPTTMHERALREILDAPRPRSAYQLSCKAAKDVPTQHSMERVLSVRMTLAIRALCDNDRHIMHSLNSTCKRLAGVPYCDLSHGGYATLIIPSLSEIDQVHLDTVTGAGSLLQI